MVNSAMEVEFRRKIDQLWVWSSVKHFRIVGRSLARSRLMESAKLKRQRRMYPHIWGIVLKSCLSGSGLSSMLKLQTKQILLVHVDNGKPLGFCPDNRVQYTVDGSNTGGVAAKTFAMMVRLSGKLLVRIKPFFRHLKTRTVAIRLERF